MNTTKFKKYLKKLKQFDKLIDGQTEDLSKVERDLLLDYIKKIYDAVLFDDEEKHAAKPKHKIKHIKNNPVDDHNEVTVQEPQGKSQEIVIEEKEIEPSNDNIPANEPEPETKPEVVKNDYSSAFMDIFEDKEKHDLSDKLSMMPIKDLRKAFGINERIFTVNELFGGDNDYFETSISDLNSFSSFEEAKDYILSKIASKFNWDSDKRIKKAAHFIKTVRRRYL